jgi:hypothetical protein
MSEQTLIELIDKKIKQWKDGQQCQTDGYEYERSFDEMMQAIGREILQESVGEIPKNKNLKKNF